MLQKGWMYRKPNLVLLFALFFCLLFETRMLMGGLSGNFKTQNWNGEKQQNLMEVKITHRGQVSPRFPIFQWHHLLNVHPSLFCLLVSSMNVAQFLDYFLIPWCHPGAAHELRFSRHGYRQHLLCFGKLMSLMRGLLQSRKCRFFPSSPWLFLLYHGCCNYQGFRNGKWENLLRPEFFFFL